MNRQVWVSVLFYIASAYDGVLGLIFLLLPLPLYEWYQITPPNHLGYVQFPAALLVVFGLMFLSIARNPARNRNLIPYGILLKVSYCAVVFGYWVSQGIPDLWKPFAIADACFILAFLWAYVQLGRGGPVAKAEPTA